MKETDAGKEKFNCLKLDEDERMRVNEMRL